MPNFGGMKKNPFIHFHFLYTSFYLPRRDRLKDFILELIEKEGRQTEHINYIFCNDEYLLAINQEHLQHDTFTDIITFDYSTNKKEKIVSDIYISIDRVKDNAQLYHTTFQKELLRVIFHGVLHLCGYKDKTKDAQQLMRSKEDYYLNQYFVSRETL